MEKKAKVKWKIILTIFIGIVSVFLYLYILNKGQNRTVTREFEQEMAEDIASLKDDYPNASKRHEYLQQSFDNICLQYFKMIREPVMDYIYGEDRNHYILNDPDLDLEKLQRVLAEASYGFYHITQAMIADMEGNIIVSWGGHIYEDLKDEIYDPLRDFTVENPFATVRILTEEDICLKYPDPEKEYFSENKEKVCNLYAAELSDDHELVISVSAIDETRLEEKSDPWTVLLQNESIGEQGYVYVWSGKTDKLLYFPDRSYKYRDVKELGMDMDRIRSGEYVWTTVNGVETYLYPVYFEDEDIWMAAAVSREELISSRRSHRIIQTTVFAFLAAALVYYVILLLRQDKIPVLTDFTGSGKKQVHQRRQYKLFIMTFVISTIILLFSFYLLTLYLMSSWANNSTDQIQKIESTAEENMKQAESFAELYDRMKKQEIVNLVRFLSVDKDRMTTDTLDKYAVLMEAADLEIMGTNAERIVGTTERPYTAILPKTNSEGQDFKQIVANQDAGKSIFDWMSGGRRELQPFLETVDEDSMFLYVFYYSETADHVLKSYSLAGTLDMARPGKNGLAFAVDKSSSTFIYFPDPKLIGSNALEYGLTERQLRDNYCDYVTINNQVYYAVTDEYENCILYFTVPKDRLLRGRPLSSATAFTAAFVLFLLIGITLYTSREQIELTTPDSARIMDIDDSQSAEFRLMLVFKYYVAAAATLVFIYSTVGYSTADGNVLGYMLERNWEKGVNVFALTASLILLCRGGILLFIASRLTNAIGNIIPSRSGTILKMVSSLFIYLITAFLIYQCMIYFGLNPTTLMASAGIVSVVLGIGANSLVGDIIAGFFLLMEGDVRVGDIIRIDGFRGYVMDMGIRMTRIYDPDSHYVKILPNNEVRNVVHMTMRKICVYNTFQIRYEEKLEDVERIIVEELKNVKDKSQYILDGPKYIGVAKLDESGVVLKMATVCHEDYRLRVEREVNHIVYTIFQKNDIGVPYPQVTLHTGDDSRVVRVFDNEEK